MSKRKIHIARRYSWDDSTSTAFTHCSREVASYQAVSRRLCVGQDYSTVTCLVCLKHQKDASLRETQIAARSAQAAVERLEQLSRKKRKTR